MKEKTQPQFGVCLCISKYDAPPNPDGFDGFELTQQPTRPTPWILGSGGGRRQGVDVSEGGKDPLGNRRRTVAWDWSPMVRRFLLTQTRRHPRKKLAVGPWGAMVH